MNNVSAISFLKFFVHMIQKVLKIFSIIGFYVEAMLILHHLYSQNPLYVLE